ncbi:MAG: anhydro-N-acetylmuramic acid kinase, partial [Planctomycetota bacterium]|nr:anhydro-N-acetylmuramic acid kinase [Planctomycetota bacterium]
MRRILDLLKKESKRVIGLMSGTSADGIDAALVEISGHGSSSRVLLKRFESFPYPADIRDRVLNLQSASAREVCEMNFIVGRHFAEAACALLEADSPRIDLIGSHGQTVCHIDPRQDATGSTLQIGEGSVIAEAT